LLLLLWRCRFFLSCLPIAPAAVSTLFAAVFAF
jgi:hypothetical protein